MTPGANLDRHPQKKKKPSSAISFLPSTTFSLPPRHQDRWPRESAPRKSEETLGGKMNLSPWRVAWERDDLEGLKGEGEDSMPFFFSSFLSLYLSFSLSLYLYISIFSCEREPSYWRDGESLLDIEWQFSLGKKRIVECWNETIFPGKSYLETRLSPDLFIFHPPPLSKIYLLALP